jgi:hypothetical protein
MGLDTGCGNDQREQSILCRSALSPQYRSLKAAECGRLIVYLDLDVIDPAEVSAVVVGGFPWVVCDDGVFDLVDKHGPPTLSGIGGRVPLAIAKPGSTD